MGSRSLAWVHVSLLVALVGCAGPDPEVTRVAVTDTARSGVVRVDVDVVNRSRGHGQITLEISLVHRGDGTTIVAERTLDLEAHQRSHVTADIPAPEGPYIARARAMYPD